MRTRNVRVQRASVFSSGTTDRHARKIRSEPGLVGDQLGSLTSCALLCDVPQLRHHLFRSRIRRILGVFSFAAGQSPMLLQSVVLAAFRPIMQAICRGTGMNQLADSAGERVSRMSAVTAVKDGRIPEYHCAFASCTGPRHGKLSTRINLGSSTSAPGGEPCASNRRWTTKT